MAAQIAIIGAGVIGETLLSVLLGAHYTPDDIVITEKRPDHADGLRRKYGVAVVDNVAAAATADIVLIAVKPQDVPVVLDEIGPVVRADSTVMSLAAGVSLATLQGAVGSGVAVIRVMPNTPMLVGEGMFGVSAGEDCSERQLDEATVLLGQCGQVVVIPEALQDALTALSGSGPAYVFLLAESMISGGVAAGLPEDTARQLTEQTIVGAAKLLKESTDSASELRKRVTSPGGTTAAAIEVLEAHEMKSSIESAISAAKARSVALSTAHDER